MAHSRVRAGRGEIAGPLGSVQHIPCGSEKQEADEDQGGAEQMERVQVRVTPRAEDGLPQMASVMRCQVEPGVAPTKPT